MVHLISQRAAVCLFVIAFFAHSSARAQLIQGNSTGHRIGEAPNLRLASSIEEREAGSPSEDSTEGSAREAEDNAGEADDLDALLDTDVTQLRNTQVAPALQMEVSTVSRQKSTVGKSPAAVTVITQEMIRRSGSRTLPDLLRMVPGVHVGKIGASRWSVSSRGFVSLYNQQLLVQIDGRSIYTPIFGGVVWNWHDLLLDDIERIEVIRGPGSTVWGANAVNGVINIITKNAKDTTGAFVEAGGGSEERAFGGFRIGGTSLRGVNWRVSGKGFDRDDGFEPNGLAGDGWEQSRINMRMDWQSNQGDNYTFQGGYFDGSAGSVYASPFITPYNNQTPMAGGNMLFRWTRQHNEDSDTTLQMWADYYENGNNIDFLMVNQTTVDVDLQHRVRWRDRHRLIWGLGYRNVWDDLQTTTGLPIVGFTPPERSAYNVSGFIQDEFEVREDKLFFTVGTKLSENTFSGFEVQPNLRLLCAIDERSVAWCSFSRAVRVPSRTDSDLALTLIPGLLTAFGNPNGVAEPLLAGEVGYRKQPVNWFSWDATLFYHDYNDLATFVLTSPTTLGLRNVQDASSYGAEIACQLDVNEHWKLRSWYSFLRLNERFTFPGSFPDASPRHQAFLMSTFNLTCRSDLDFITRYVDDLRGQDVGAYIQADVRYAWRPRPNVEVSVVGQNLFEAIHEESTNSPFVPEIGTSPQRGVYGMVQYRY